MTAKQFAEKMDINYRTALNWLEAEIVPGAERKTSPIGQYWEIPETSLNMERPKPGPKPKAAKKDQTNGVAKKATKKASKK